MPHIVKVVLDHDGTLTAWERQVHDLNPLLWENAAALVKDDTPPAARRRTCGLLATGSPPR